MRPSVDPRLEPLARAWNRIFWDAPMENVDVEAHADGVMARILALGDLDQARWMLRTYGADRVRDYMRRKGGYQLVPMALGFWCLVLDVPAEECTNKSSLPTRRPFFKP